MKTDTSDPTSILTAKTLDDNAGWCWYQDERVVVDDVAGTVLCATVANLEGPNGERRNGDIDVTAYRPGDGWTHTFNLSKIPTHGRGDDHNGAALWVRPDGRYLAVYTGHNYGNGSHTGPEPIDREPKTFYRLSTRPHDATAWEPEQVFTWPSNDPTQRGRNHVTYSNLLHLSAEGGDRGRLYNIARAAGQSMHIATSDDWGETWTYRGLLSRPPVGSPNYSNGYFKFTTNGVDRIDFIATEAHPRDFNNGVYHGYIHGGQTFDADGKLIDPQTYSEEGPPPKAFTPLFNPGPVEADQRHHGWTTEIKWCDDGSLVALFTSRFGVEQQPEKFVRGGPGDAEHRLFFARFADGAWAVEEVCRMGPGLHPGEEDYTGLGTIDPRTGRRLIVSTPIDPRDDAVLPHHELFVAERDGHTGPWRWQPLTAGSDEDHLRPLLALPSDGRALLFWLRGTYHEQILYDQALVAAPVQPHSPFCG